MRSDKELFLGWFKIHGMVPTCERAISYADNCWFLNIVAEDKRLQFDKWNTFYKNRNNYNEQETCWKFQMIILVRNVVFARAFEKLASWFGLVSDYSKTFEDGDYTLALDTLMQKLNDEDSTEFYWKRKAFGQDIYKVFKSREELEVLLAVNGI